MPIRRFVSLIALVIAAAALTIGLGAGLAPFVPAQLSMILMPVPLVIALIVRDLAGRRVRTGEAGGS